MANDMTAERSKDLVRSFYDAGARDDFPSFFPTLADDFKLFVPPQLPWGGEYDRAGYMGILPTVGSTLDFANMRFESFTAEGDHVVALIDIGVKGTDKSVLISEHWDTRNEKAIRLLVAYYDPTTLLERFRGMGSSAPIERASQAANLFWPVFPGGQVASLP